MTFPFFPGPLRNTQHTSAWSYNDCWRTGSFVKAEKCVFNAPSVEFLGHIMEKGQVRADPKKVRAVEEGAQPADRTQLRRFLGFANFYRRFIRGFS